MKLHQLMLKNKSKKRQRVGRGISAGGGKSAGRGTKGQKSRSGFNIPLRFEGGQTPLIQRLPKKIGFKGRNNRPLIIKTSIIDKNYSNDGLVSPKTLKDKGLIGEIKAQQKIKILFDRPIKKKLILKDCLSSKRAGKYFEK